MFTPATDRAAFASAFASAYACASVAVTIPTVWHAPTINGSGTKHAHRRTLS